MNSSYNNTVTFGDVLDGIVTSLGPKSIVEVGILEGFSLKRFADRSSGDTVIRAYDIFGQFNGNHAVQDELIEKFRDHHNVSIEYGDFYDVHAHIEDVDMIHIDVANDGDVGGDDGERDHSRQRGAHDADLAVPGPAPSVAEDDAA